LKRHVLVNGQGKPHYMSTKKGK
jgi:hypothetical protein